MVVTASGPAGSVIPWTRGSARSAVGTRSRARARAAAIRLPRVRWRGDPPPGGRRGPAVCGLRAVDALHAHNNPDDAEWAALVAATGEAGAIDALAICGWVLRDRPRGPRYSSPVRASEARPGRNRLAPSTAFGGVALGSPPASGVLCSFVRSSQDAGRRANVSAPAPPADPAWHRPPPSLINCVWNAAAVMARVMWALRAS